MAQCGADLQSLRSTCKPLYGSSRLQVSVFRHGADQVCSILHRLDAQTGAE
jgi:hypothetical protein